MDLFLEKEGGNYSYSCLMWRIPKSYSDLIMAWGNCNISNNDIYNDENDNSFGRENDPHVTILYGLITENSDEVKKVIDKFSKFYMTFGKISKFPATKEKPYDVLKLEIKNDKLNDLHNLIKGSLKNVESYPVYNPHVTIAYCKPGTCDHLLNKIIFSSNMKVEVKNVTFSSSGNIKKKTIIPLKN